MIDVIEDLKYLADEYESGEHVDISARNYFQDALDEIERLLADNDGWKMRVESMTRSCDVARKRIEELEDGCK